MQDRDLIHLLWTGGWDSSFRLLQLVLIERKKVQPYYITDHDRRSTPNELQAMAAIKAELFEHHPYTERLILPTIHYAKKRIKPNEAITRRWRALNKIKLGKQYEWIAQYTEQVGVRVMEICHEKKPSPSKFDLILLPELIGEGHACRLRETVQSDVIEMYRNFRFPIIHLQKTDMERIAEDHHFIDLLKMSWFCHEPNRDGSPCECCRPCQFARKAGHSHGMPKTNFPRDQWLTLQFRFSHLLRKMAL